jgi:hypothetical protein
MKRLIAVVIVLALIVVGVGFYRGWFALSSSSADQGSNKVNVNLTVDRDKMQEDARAVQSKTAELTGTVTEEVKGPGDLKKDDEKKSNDR